ncbi:MAG: serine hydrolase, partial [Chitinophagaceae bacterium]|nr:serine hydrolase [Chitinophagaceae bacterium]
AIELPFAEPDAEARIHTQAALVVYKGQIVAEKYAPGFNKDTRLIGWSMGKSITSALIGILVKQGKLDISKPAPVAEWKNDNDPRHAITLQNLLQQTTGLDFEENYSKPSGATNMLFKRGDMAAYAANSPLKHKPGSTFYYSSGNSNILARIVRTTVGEKDYESFLFNELFYKIGMNDFIFEPDASGTFVGSSYPFGTARDYARFGLLYLNDGVWNGERILPEGWVKQTTTPAVANNEKEYGFQFWLNGISAENPQQHIYPNVHADMFYADGYNGQRIYIIPSRQLVVVRLGLHKFDENKFLEAVLDAVE